MISPNQHFHSSSLHLKTTSSQHRTSQQSGQKLKMTHSFRLDGRDYQNQTQVPSLPKQNKNARVCPSSGAKCKTEQAATTILLSQSQKEEQRYEPVRKDINLLLRQHYSRVTYRIAPFVGNQEQMVEKSLMSRRLQKRLNRCQLDEVWNRRCLVLPNFRNNGNSRERMSSLHANKQSSQEDSSRFWQVAINNPQLGHLFPKQNCLYSTKMWKIAFAAGQQRINHHSRIRKPISLSLCQIASNANSKNGSINIQKFIPSIHSKSLPIKPSSKFEKYQAALSKQRAAQSDRLKESKMASQMQDSTYLLLTQPDQLRLTIKDQQQVKAQSNQSRLNMSNIFRKLDSFKKRNSLQAKLQKYKSLPIQHRQQKTQKERRSPVQLGNKLSQIRYKLMKSDFKLRRTSSFHLHK